MDQNLLEYLNNFNTSLVPLTCIQYITREVLQGLNYMHNSGYFHRDLKPENILISGNQIKIADFGLCREVDINKRLTKYVSTRWYRAPEVLLGCKDYSCPIDIWALGCIISELVLRKPLLPGDNEIDQLYKICSVVGRPDGGNSLGGSWELGVQMGLVMGYRFPSVGDPSLIYQLQLCYPSISNELIHLIISTLQLDPLKRPKASELLTHPCLTNFPAPVCDLKSPELIQSLDTNLPDLPNYSPMSNGWVNNDRLNISPSVSLQSSIHKKQIKRRPNCFFDTHSIERSPSVSSSIVVTPSSSTKSPQLRRLSNIDSNQFAHARRLSAHFDFKFSGASVNEEGCQSEKLNRRSLYHTDKIATRSLPRSFQPNKFVNGGGEQEVTDTIKPPSSLATMFQDILPQGQEKAKQKKMDKFDSLAAELINLMEEKIDSIGNETQFEKSHRRSQHLLHHHHRSLDNVIVSTGEGNGFLPKGLGLELFQ